MDFDSSAVASEHGALRPLSCPPTDDESDEEGRKSVVYQRASPIGAEGPAVFVEEGASPHSAQAVPLFSGVRPTRPQLSDPGTVNPTVPSPRQPGTNSFGSRGCVRFLQHSGRIRPVEMTASGDRDLVSLHADDSVPAPALPFRHSQSVPGSLTDDFRVGRVAVRGLHNDEERIKNYIAAFLGCEISDADAKWSPHDDTFLVTFQLPQDVRKLVQHPDHEIDEGVHIKIFPALPEIVTVKLSYAFHFDLSDAGKPLEFVSLPCTLHNGFQHHEIGRFTVESTLSRVAVVIPRASYEHLRQKKLCTENPDSTVTLKFENSQAVTLRRLQPVDCVRAVLGEVENGCYLVRHIAVDADGFTEDDFKRFIGRAIEDDDRLAIANVIWDSEDGRALVVVEGIASRGHCDKTYNKLRSYVYHEPFKCQMVCVEQIPQSRQLKIDDLHPELTEKTLRFHFEKFIAPTRKKEGGSNGSTELTDQHAVRVDKVDSKAVALVTFQTRRDLDIVLKNKEHDLVIKKHKIKVKMHYDLASL